MARRPTWRPRPNTSLRSGVALVVVGIAAITLSNQFDGFVQGLLGGGGVALVLIGVAAMSPLLRKSAQRQQEKPGRPGADGVDADDQEQGWLPSRDSRP